MYVSGVNLTTITSRFNSFFFFNDTATTEIYTLSLHDALPISFCESAGWRKNAIMATTSGYSIVLWKMKRSEEHTSELQSQSNLVCRLLLEKNNSLSIHAAIVKSGFAVAAFI